MVGNNNSHNKIIKFLPLVLLAVIFVTFIAFEGYRLFDVETLQTSYQKISALIHEHFFLSLLMFILIYALSTAISFPGATILSLVGGFLFGTTYGGLGILCGATLGAAALFLAARLALADFLRPRIAPYLQKFEKGFQRDAFSYLMMLRLIPIFPFFVVNLVPAFLAVSFRIYLITTFLGILPASFIYAGLGAAVDNVLALEKINLSFFARPEIWMPLAGLALLALLPILVKKRKQRKN